MTNNPYAKIKQNSIMTASPQELTLMLYNGAIKFANQAVIAINENNPKEAHEKIVRVENIIREFILTLDHTYPVADDMAAMYDYLKRRLSQANIKKDAEILEEVIGFLREFRDTWKEAMNSTKKPQQNNELIGELIGKQAQ